MKKNTAISAREICAMTRHCWCHEYIVGGVICCRCASVLEGAKVGRVTVPGELAETLRLAPLPIEEPINDRRTQQAAKESVA